MENKRNETLKKDLSDEVSKHGNKDGSYYLKLQAN